MKSAGCNTIINSKALFFCSFIHYLTASILLLSFLDSKPAAAEASMKWKLNGFAEIESYIDTSTNQDTKDAVKKNEIHNRLEAQYGTENVHLFVRSDLYLLPQLLNKSNPNEYQYSDEDTFARNLQISGRRYDWAFNELYLNYMASPLRLRIGNQTFHWGTADVFNPTAYFNPYDFREFLFRDDDELRQGVPSLSAMHFSDDVTTEFVFSFVHIPMLLASEENFWSIDMEHSFYTISVKEYEGMAPTISNSAVGARISADFFNSDISFSIFRGPDREAVLVPEAIEFLPNSSPVIEVEPHYEIITMAGMDFSKALGDIVIQFEAAYSPDKPNIVMQDFNAPLSVHLPFEIRTSDYISYAAGFNYYIPLSDIFENHTGESVFTLDWFQSHFFDEDLATPFFSDILTLRFQDSYLDGRFGIEMTTMFETRYGGSIYWPEIKFDFLNGWTAQLSYASIDGNRSGESIEPLFYHFRNNDIGMLKIRYEF